MITIYSKHHLLISVLVGGTIGVFTTNSAIEIVIVVLYSGFVGVFIDLDHFLISRVKTGNWTALLNCIQTPIQSLFYQKGIFREGEVEPSERIVSHLVIIGGGVSILWFISKYWAFVSLVVLYMHLLTDSIADTFDLYERV